ncbi:elongation factor 2-like [Planoprotostelium fungivorum]|uniref:Elongation factor 2-like n=1 Tax=Planoprotostelium fungivorum TaxID=1890364 RepID=A0A2P6MS75_9EUKA|nr:elongation factor 2-like [Planoprotostelium fungivorum]
MDSAKRFALAQARSQTWRTPRTWFHPSVRVDSCCGRNHLEIEDPPTLDDSFSSMSEERRRIRDFLQTSVVYWSHRLATALISNSELWCLALHAQAKNYPSVELSIQVSANRDTLRLLLPCAHSEHDGDLGGLEPLWTFTYIVSRKFSLTDSLVAASIIAREVRLTTPSVSLSLLFKFSEEFGALCADAKGKSFSINLTDYLGHVNFSSEVTALRIPEGSLAVVDI